MQALIRRHLNHPLNHSRPSLHFMFIFSMDFLEELYTVLDHLHVPINIQRERGNRGIEKEGKYSETSL